MCLAYKKMKANVNTLGSFSHILLKKKYPRSCLRTISAFSGKPSSGFALSNWHCWPHAYSDHYPLQDNKSVQHLRFVPRVHFDNRSYFWQHHAMDLKIAPFVFVVHMWVTSRAVLSGISTGCFETIVHFWLGEWGRGRGVWKGQGGESLSVNRNGQHFPDLALLIYVRT